MVNSKEHTLILFDGICNFCNGSVNFIINRDRNDSFRFIPIQSDAGKNLCKQLGVNPLENDTFIVYKGGKVYTRSTAALRIVKKLSGLWPALYVFYFVPKFIRDSAYHLIAKNRYKWFGKKNSCMVPTPELREKFIV